MLVIVSDLHLSDGSTTETVSPGAFDIFVERLQDMAYRASWRSDGSYRPIERLDLVLLGDVLDLINSDTWLQSGARPWHDPQSASTVESVTTTLDRIFHHNPLQLASLRGLSHEGQIALPPASQSGQPIAGADGYPLQVRTHYMVGNRDWLLHVGGTSYDLIRRKVVQQMGLASSPDSPFAHDPTECPELINALRRHRVIARHGDIFDPLSYSEDRDVASVGDVILIDLILRFTREIQHLLGDALPLPIAARLSELDQIRPLVLAPAWLGSLLERSCPSGPLRKEIKRIWDALADELLEVETVRNQDAASPYPLIDGLEQALKFSRRTRNWAQHTTGWLHGLRGSDQASYFPHALAEADFRNRRARHIVYGHTHYAEQVALEASHADGFSLDQMYFNAGTWQRSYQATHSPSSEQEFIAQESLQCLSFYTGDERSGRLYETWSGSLGGCVAVPPSHRLDAARPAAVRQPARAVKPPMGAPHFRSAPAARSHVNQSY